MVNNSLVASLLWWVAVSGLSWISLPICLWFFRDIPSRGYALSRALALLLFAYLTWILGISGLVRYGQGAVILAVLLMAGASGYVLMKTKAGGRAATMDFLRTHARFVIVSELLFATAFAFALFLRGFVPEISGTEKPMEMTFLNAFLRADVLPPQDPWLSGFSINYYYFGYLLMGSLTRLTGVASEVAFNVAGPLLFALTVITSFGVGYDLVASLAAPWGAHSARNNTSPANQRQPVAGRMAYVGGFLSAAFVAVIGNLYAAEKLLGNPSAVLSDSWWTGIGWNSSRVVVDQIGTSVSQTINEFPYFSFLLSDLHPHVIALPFTILVIGIAFQLVRSSWGKPAVPAIQGGSNEAATSSAALAETKTTFSIVRLIHADRLLIALALGALYFMNSWDYPTYLLLVAAAIVVGARSGEHGAARSWTATAWTIGEIVVLSVALYLPFHLTFHSLVGGSSVALPDDLASLPLVSRLARYIGIVVWSKTSLDQILTVFGFFLCPVLVCLMALAVRERVRAWGAMKRDLALAVAATAAVVAAAWMAGFPVLALTVPAATAGIILLLRRNLGPEESLVALMSSIALLLIFGCELVYLQDVFHDRMNTIFKFYYQAWTLLGISAAFCIVWLARRIRLPEQADKRASRALGIMGLSASVILLCGSFVYPVVATYQRTDHFQEWKGLDGLAWMKLVAPADYDGIAWLRQHVTGTPVILEATGNPYSEFGRVSTFTGLPTVLGWANHEFQWRGGQPAALDQISVRAADVDTIYATTDNEMARQLLDKYQVQYVYVGSIERGERERRGTGPWKYSQPALDKFGQLGEVVFQEGNVTIYRIRQ